MKKFIVICLLFSQFIFTAKETVFILPSQIEVFSLLSLHIRSWSKITLKDLSQELAEKTHSKTSLNNYLLEKMFGDTQVTCTELSNAAEAIAEKSNKELN